MEEKTKWEGGSERERIETLRKMRLCPIIFFLPMYAGHSPCYNIKEKNAFYKIFDQEDTMTDNTIEKYSSVKQILLQQ